MKTTRRSGPPALDLLEEAVSLLRTAPAGLLLTYYVGTGPFVLGGLFYWADMSRGAWAEARCAAGALGLALLFLWMKLWQALFASQLRALLASETPPPWTWRRVWRTAAVQAALQPAGLILIPTAALLAVPFAWTFAFFQNATALADRTDGLARECARRAWRQARLWSSANHGGLFILLLVGLLTWLNVVIGLIAAPYLLKMLLGIESDFTLSFWTFFNTTFLAVTLGLAWLILDPVVKTFYALRCFRGEALANGEDLRAALRALGNPIPGPVAQVSPLTARLLVVGLSLFLFQPPTPAAAAQTHEAPAPALEQAVPTTATPAELDHALDSVLARREYTWREPRDRPLADDTAGQDWLTRAVNSVMKSLRELLENVGRAVTRIFDWLIRRRLSRIKTNGDTSLFDWTAGFETLFWILVATATLLLIYFSVRAWRKARPRTVVDAAPVAAAPDLRDENVGAEQLPEDGWLSLARDLMAKGDLRLALRALYLASLAHLARREFIVLARFKSNREYERELARRARTQPQLQGAFTENVASFDRVWYGRHLATPELLAEFEANVSSLRSTETSP